MGLSPNENGISLSTQQSAAAAMDDHFSEPLIRGYLDGVRAKGTLVSELRRIQDLLIEYTKHPHPDKAYQRALVARTNQLFRALLSLTQGSAPGSR